MTIALEAPDSEASLMKAAAASNTTVDECAARMLRLAFATEYPATEDTSLRGSVLYYERRLEPVAVDDWEAVAEQPGLQATSRASSGYGKFAHIQTSSDEFAARKDER